MPGDACASPTCSSPRQMAEVITATATVLLAAAPAIGTALRAAGKPKKLVGTDALEPEGAIAIE